MILPTDIPTPAQVERLLAARNPSSISIYLPTDPVERGARSGSSEAPFVPATQTPNSSDGTRVRAG
jgi:hypothetical protein